MDKVIDINEVKIGKGKALLKVVEKKSAIITPGKDSGEALFSHYEVIKLNKVDNIDVNVGDLVVAASGIGSQGGFVYNDEVYIIVNGFNMDAVTAPDNFKL